MSLERLQKIIAASGLASRRKAEELILAGLVSVNGKITRELGQKANPETDTILVKNKPLPSSQTVTYLLNKPKGVVSSTKRQGKEPIVTDLVPSHPIVYPVGRLDKDSQGLLLLTNNGELANHLTHPSFAHVKVYRVVVKPKSPQQALKETEIVTRLLKGVKLGDGLAKADEVSSKALPDHRYQLTITVHEGRQHLIRRMCATIGFDVITLKRIKIGRLSLGKLASGQFRILSTSEVTTLT